MTHNIFWQNKDSEIYCTVLYFIMFFIYRSASSMYISINHKPRMQCIAYGTFYGDSICTQNYPSEHRASDSDDIQ